MTFGVYHFVVKSLDLEVKVLQGLGFLFLVVKTRNTGENFL